VRSKAGPKYKRDTAARSARTSRTAFGAAFSEKLIKLLKKSSYVSYFYEYKAVRPIIKAVVLNILRRRWRFTFNGREYHYFYHPYNNTWQNERALELPIIWEEVEKVDAERVLELGNVLSRYHLVHHDIVDKHENGDGVITSDICDFHAPKMYDLIVSISTIEHIGFDEDYPVGRKSRIQPEKSLRVIQLLKGMLSKKGQLIVTVPLGHNLILDRLLKEETENLFTRKAYLKRISKSNRWAEVEDKDIHGAKYDSPFNYGNVLAICTFERGKSR
jgi:hypothetical protein